MAFFFPTRRYTKPAGGRWSMEIKRTRAIPSTSPRWAISQGSDREASLGNMQDQVEGELSAPERTVQVDGEGRTQIQAIRRPNISKLLNPVPGTVNAPVFIIIINNHTISITQYRSRYSNSHKRRNESQCDLDVQEPDRLSYPRL